jgi:hypothetical protein
MLLQTIFTTGRAAELLVREGTLLSRIIAIRQAAARQYELALFAGRQSAYDVNGAGYGWQEADFTTRTGLLLCDSQAAFATHIGIIMPMAHSCHAEFAGAEPCVWIGGTEQGGIFGYNAAFFAL